MGELKIKEEAKNVKKIINHTKKIHNKLQVQAHHQKNLEIIYLILQNRNF